MVGTLSHGINYRAPTADEVLGFTGVTDIFVQNEASEVFFPRMFSFGFPFNPTYRLVWHC